MSVPASLGAHTGYRLRLVSNAVSQDFARRLGKEGATVAEWAFLRMLYDVDAVPPSVLARSLGLTKGAVSKLADRLLVKSFVKRAANPDDKRAHSLSLTPKGREKVPVLAKIADEVEAFYFEVLQSDQREALRTILATIVELRDLHTVPVY